ncbi:MAG: TadE/TadG family type IV pilus assembly protein [Brevibacterium yomogidense]
MNRTEAVLIDAEAPVRTQENRRTPRERGSATIEFTGTFFIWLTIVMVCLQAALAMFALSQANSAARNAARAEVVTVGAGQAAGKAALSAPLRSGSSTSCTSSAMVSSTGSVTCSVTVAMPILALDWITERVSPVTVTRDAEQPMTEVR